MEKWRLHKMICEKEREQIFNIKFVPSCGDGEIRTLDTVTHIHTFQACSFSHSDTSPFFLAAKIHFQNLYSEYFFCI